MDYIQEEREKIIRELLDSKKVKAGEFINYAKDITGCEKEEQIIYNLLKEIKDK